MHKDARANESHFGTHAVPRPVSKLARYKLAQQAGDSCWNLLLQSLVWIPVYLPQRGCGRLKFISIAVSIALSIALSITTSMVQAQDTSEHPLRWWKGNLHTHSLWSDGDDFPEMIAAWYADRNYNFLALSDHNVLSRGQRWMSMKQVVGRADDQIIDRYREKFGSDWVETRGTVGQADYEVRLKPLDEFRCLVEQRGQFLMIQGEEISDKAEGKPVHMNATNVSEELKPLGGANVQEVMQNNLRLVLEHEKTTGRQILPHLNHPNFGYAVTAEDIARVVEERFFEIYNGHPGVNQLGDKDHLSIEAMWDVVNAMRLVLLAGEPILGIATDDSHEYHGLPGARPGRGWVMVRSRYLTPEHLIRAMKAGDFYASSGVVLDEVRFDTATRTLSLSIAPQPNATFETQFIVLPKPMEVAAGEQPQLPVARVAASVRGLKPSYQLTGQELYVRALVTSSLAHTDPSLDGQMQQAWTQPVGWRKE